MKLYTIGYRGKSAHLLFDKLERNGVRKVIDVRQNPNGAYSGYTRKKDFSYLLSLINVEYEHKLLWAPSNEVRKEAIWSKYVEAFNELIVERKMFSRTNAADIDGCCLMCAEEGANECHRSLLAAALTEKFPGLEVIHL